METAIDIFYFLKGQIHVLSVHFKNVIARENVEADFKVIMIKYFM